MIARLLISPSLESRMAEINKALALHIGSVKNNHPDILYFKTGEKLGIEQARKIKEHFSLKPYSARGRVVVLEDASNLTVEAQNALLKILEEPPAEALLILGAQSDAKLLPTILSRCQIITLPPERLASRSEWRAKSSDYKSDIEKLMTLSFEERFEYIEKLKNREEFLHALVDSFHQDLSLHPRGDHLDSLPSHIGSGNTDYINFLKELLQTEEWAAQNVNIRAILEYLMLRIPKSL